MLIWFLSNHCILCLVLRAWNQEKNTDVCMASILLSNGRILAQLDKIHLKFSTHAYFAVRFHPMLSKYEISKNSFYDAITDHLYSGNIRQHSGSHAG